MSSESSSSTDLLLELLELLAHGAMDRAQIRKAFSRAALRPPKVARWSAALDALEDEGLIESDGNPGRSAYRTNAAGLHALHERRRDPGIVAVLFTDLVGSTSLIATFGEAGAHRLRRRHFSLLREAVAAHGGHEVKSLGDGLMVVFSDAARAVACAEAMQFAAARDGDGLGLRIGIEAGEPERDGDDFFGTPVIVARRLCDAGKRGQIVVSELVRRLADRCGERRYESLGPLSLKGLQEPVLASALPVPATAPS